MTASDTALRTGLNGAGTIQDIPAEQRYSTTSHSHFHPEAVSVLAEKVP
jgi:hypothetical protein